MSWLVGFSASADVQIFGPESLESDLPALSVQAWGVDEGLPGTHVNEVVQDEEGLLWLATLTGLVRFDGSSFQIFDSANSDLPSHRLSVAYLAPSGRFWLGTEQGHLIEKVGDRFVPVADPPYPGAQVSSLAEDASGALWVSRGGGGGQPDRPLLWQLAEGGLTPRPDLDAWWLADDGHGGIAARAHDEGLAALHLHSRFLALTRDRAGDVWGQMPLGRIVRLRDGLSDPMGKVSQSASSLTGPTLLTHDRGETIEVFDSDRETRLGILPYVGWASIVLVDRRGRIWTTHLQEGWLRAYHGESREAIYHLPIASPVKSMMEDDAGNLWVATQTRGLLRIAESPVRTFLPEEGPPLPTAVGFTTEDGVFVESAPPNLVSPLYRLDGEPLSPWLNWMTRDRRGTLWAFEPGELVGRVDGSPERRLETLGIWVAEDPEEDGILWVITQRELQRVDARGNGPPSLSGSWPMVAHVALLHDPAGGLWIGCEDGLRRLQNDQIEHWGRAEGLRMETVRALLADGRGGLWLGTYGGGLVHFDGQDFTAIGVEQGLPEAIVSSLDLDRFGGLWMAGNRGIHRIRLAELEDVLAGRQSRLDAVSFGAREGLPSPETTGRPPARSDDGRLWYATFGGVVALDPEVFHRREIQVPRAFVSAIGTGDEPGRRIDSLEIPPDASRDLHVEFTAIHLVAPDTLRFRYRLAPLEDAWVDAAEPESVRYRDLPPGRYRFHLQARHSGGAWADAAIAPAVNVQPKFRETFGFDLLLGFLGLAILAAGWAVSTRQIRRRARQLERAVAERTAALEAERDTVSLQAARLAELAEARSQFMAGISHELRTPLTLILGPLLDLRDGALGPLPPAASREIETTVRSADRLRRLVDRLLGVARAEVELNRLQCREIDLAGLVVATVEELRPLASRQGSALRADLPGAAVPVWFDALQLQTVLINLVANAIKHTPAGTPIEVSVRPRLETGKIELAVRDEGPGIPESELPHLFERFYRGREANQDASGGFGLGLALVREVIERHGGRIDVTSSSSGTTFTAQLRVGRDHLSATDLAPFDEVGTPQRSPELAWAADPPSAFVDDDDHPWLGLAGDEDRTTVLVVDDNPELRRLVRRQLEDRYRVLEAADGREALARLGEELPDLVLSDVMMPDLDGYELCRAIRADPAIDFVPVVLLTARASAESQVEGLGQGADAYLAKPFNRDVLRATVANLIASRRRLRDRYAAALAADTGPPTIGEPLAEPDLGRADERYLERVDQAIAAHLHDEDFTVDQLSELVHQSRVTLYRNLQRVGGGSPSDRIREARLQRASDLLARGEGSVAEVAYAVGFKSTSHFSNCFVARYGIRPSEM